MSALVGATAVAMVAGAVGQGWILWMHHYARRHPLPDGQYPELGAALITLVAAGASLLVMPLLLWAGAGVVRYPGSTALYVLFMSLVWLLVAATTAIAAIATDVPAVPAVLLAALGYVGTGALLGGLNG